jgi:hypothetical protein
MVNTTFVAPSESILNNSTVRHPPRLTTPDVTTTITIATIRGMQGKAKIVSLTAYDFVTAKLLDEVGSCNAC